MQFMYIYKYQFRQEEPLLQMMEEPMVSVGQVDKLVKVFLPFWFNHG